MFSHQFTVSTSSDIPAILKDLQLYTVRSNQVNKKTLQVKTSSPLTPETIDRLKWSYAPLIIHNANILSF